MRPRNIIKFFFIKLFFPRYKFVKTSQSRLDLYFMMGVFQRILKVNRSVPWPVHWSSIVNNVDRINRKWERSTPGFMPAQYIQAKNGIELGYNIRIGPGVKLISANHDVYDYDNHPDGPPIVIGDNCWLGANCIILPGVVLGNHTVVAAGAVVSKSFPHGNCVIAGVPGEIKKKLGEYKGNEYKEDNIQQMKTLMFRRRHVNQKED